MKRWRRNLVDVIAALIFATALYSGGGYLIEAWRGSSEGETLERLSARYPNRAQERVLAELYWSRHRDVRTSQLYGEQGELGVYGARAHYLRYGRQERRLWPEAALKR